MSTIQQKLGRVIRTHRKSKNYSTAEIAEKLGVSVGLINNIENARNDVFKLDLLMNISNILDISTTEWLDLSRFDSASVKLEDPSKIVIEYSPFDFSDQNNAELINSYLVEIMKLFIATITSNNFDNNKIQIFGDCLINQIQAILEFSNIQ